MAESVASHCDRGKKSASDPANRRRRFAARWGAFWTTDRTSARAVRAGAAALTCAALLLHAGSSLAQESPKAARQAYDEASEAYKQRDYEAAAALFGKADAIAPNPVALEQAIRAAVRADQPVIGMELVRRALKREADGTLREAAEEGRAAFEDRVAAAAPSKSEPSAPAPKPAVDRGTGESPAWFWIGVGTTAAFGLATIASAVDTGNQHDEYVKDPSPENADAGQSAQTRTHALLGFTAATGVATVLIGAVAVRWTDPKSQLTGALHPTQGGAAVTLTGRF